MNTSLAVQVGGTHYKSMPVQPVQFALVHGLNTCQANILKYICRHAHKNGADDLKKAIHYCDLWLDIAREHRLPWSQWALNPPAGERPITEFIVKNALPVAVGDIVRLVCWLPAPARVKTARAVLVGLLMECYGEVA